MTAPLGRRPVGVVQVADLIWLTHPDPADRLTAAVWRAVVPSLARRARRVITLSEASKQELVSRLGVPAERVDVVPLGPGAEPEAAPSSETELRQRASARARPTCTRRGRQAEAQELDRAR